MIPAHYINEAELTYDGMTARERDIYEHGFADGQHCARNEEQPRLSDLEIRIDTATGIVREAIEALYKPSF
jgi:hypothetical protein